jgi:hypothetical protein
MAYLLMSSQKRTDDWINKALVEISGKQLSLATISRRKVKAQRWYDLFSVLGPTCIFLKDSIPLKDLTRTTKAKWSVFLRNLDEQRSLINEAIWSGLLENENHQLQNETNIKRVVRWWRREISSDHQNISAGSLQSVTIIATVVKHYLNDWSTEMYGSFIMSQYLATECNKNSTCCIRWVNDAKAISNRHFNEPIESSQWYTPIGMRSLDDIISILLPVKFDLSVQQSCRNCGRLSETLAEVSCLNWAGGNVSPGIITVAPTLQQRC